MTLQADGNDWVTSSAIQLEAGSFHPLTLEVDKVKDNMTLSWETQETTGQGREPIPEVYLYPKTLVDHLQGVYVRFLKAASLASSLKLSAADIAYLAAWNAYQIGGDGWLNSLAVTGAPDQGQLGDWRDRLAMLLRFAQTKADLVADDRLVAALAAQGQEDAGIDPDLLAVTRWDPASVDSLLKRFGLDKMYDHLGDPETFLRVADASRWLRLLGVSADALIAAATNDPDGPTTRAFQAALRARYEEAAWLAAIKPINDEMRRLQRDALVAYILQGMRGTNPDIDTADKLFEYFLMDVSMEPATLTSRIRHALSSVQLFIDRCLMSLEPRVAPSVLDSQEWAWMKRYRVWEANREVFLWPENWLEPELRDDQSPIFKELMNELLQGDVTDDKAAEAYLNYLGKLEGVAKLQPVGLHLDENPDAQDPRGDVLHVVARNPSTHKCYYRRCELWKSTGTGSWTPWEEVKGDIEKDAPVLPVVWRNPNDPGSGGRLFLFWLRFYKQKDLSAPDVPQSGDTATIMKGANALGAAAGTYSTYASLSYSEYHNGKWQPAKTSDVNAPVLLSGVPVPASAFALDAYVEPQGLRINVISSGPYTEYSPYGGFLLVNTHSVPSGWSSLDATAWTTEVLARYVLLEGRPIRLFSPVVADIDGGVRTDPDTFTVVYAPDGTNEQTEQQQRPVVRSNGADPLNFLASTPLIVVPQFLLSDAWQAPLLYEDLRYAYLITTQKSVPRTKDWTVYVPVAPSAVAREVPPLYRNGGDPAVRLPGYGAVDPVPVESAAAGTGGIRMMLPTQGAVRFGAGRIGATGLLQVNGFNKVS
jgi:hypothetical protein